MAARPGSSRREGYNAPMIPAVYQVPAAVLLLVGGLLSCFLGYRIFRIVLAIYGFILGALVATSVLGAVETSTTVLVGLGGGLAGALLLVFAYFVGVALVGAALAAVLVHFVWSYAGGDPHPLVVIVACVVGALASLSLQRTSSCSARRSAARGRCSSACSRWPATKRRRRPRAATAG